MQRLLPFAAVLLAISCAPKKEPKVVYHHTGKMINPDSTIYIVFMRPAFFTPFEEGLKGDTLDQKNVESKKLKHVLDYVKNFKPDIRPSAIQVDPGPSFTIKLDSASAAKMSRDTENVELMEEDFDVHNADPSIEGRPIQQGKPIQQGEPYLISTGGDDWKTCAVVVAGSDGTAGSKTIWIIDTGITPHPGVLNIDAARSNNFVTPGATTEDDNGHGTHVAGIAGGGTVVFTDDHGRRYNINIGVAPMAPLVALKVLKADGSGKYNDVHHAFQWIKNHSAKSGDIINLSLGGKCADCAKESPSLLKDLDQAAKYGFYVVMAAGNDNGDANTNFPGCYSGNTNLFTVGALDCNKACASYSNFGAPPVDFVEVGSQVFSTYMNDPVTHAQQYAILSGTSMSAAVMSGVLQATDGPYSILTIASSCTQTGVTYKIARKSP